MGKTTLIEIDARTIAELDRLVKEGAFAGRSQAIRAAVSEKLGRLKRSRLTRECARLDPAEEIAWAEKGMAEDMNRWTEY